MSVFFGGGGDTRVDDALCLHLMCRPISKHLELWLRLFELFLLYTHLGPFIFENSRDSRVRAPSSGDLSGPPQNPRMIPILVVYIENVNTLTYIFNLMKKVAQVTSQNLWDFICENCSLRCNATSIMDMQQLPFQVVQLSEARACRLQDCRIGPQ